MKTTLILIAASLAVLLPARNRIVAQTPTPAEVIASIDRSATALRSLQGDFVQTKELSLLQERMVSRGVIYYRQAGGALRWEYLTPYRYTFILNGERVMMRSGDRTDVIETAENRVFREIARLMMNSLTGRSLATTSDFEVHVIVEPERWVVELTPRRREMEQFFARIRLSYDPSRQLVSRVELIERSGDRTTIELKNLKTNRTIDEGVFAVD